MTGRVAVAGTSPDIPPAPHRAAGPAPAAYHRIAGLAAAASGARPGPLAARAAQYLLVTLVLSTLWVRAAEQTGGTLAGYRGSALIWYITATEVTAFAASVRLVEVVGDDIRSGRYELHLLQPASTLWARVASELGGSAPRLAVLATMGAGTALVRTGHPPGSVAGLALAAPALVVAIATAAVAQHLVAAAGFWVRDVRGSWFLYQKLQFTLGGLVLPLEVLPEPMARVARLTPFAALSYVPGRLASGHVEPGLLATQLGWLALLALATTRVYRAGERHLTDGGR